MADDTPEVTLESVQEELKAANEKVAGFADMEGNLKVFKADMMKYKAKTKTQEGELEALRKAKADGTTDEGDKGKQYQEIFDKKDKALAEKDARIRDLTVFGSIKSLAAKHGAINPDDVVTLMKGQITFDDKGETVIMGGKVNDKTGKAYSLDDFTVEFLSGRQHLIRSSGNSGAGSTGGSGGGAGSSGKTYTREQVAAMSHDQYAKAKAENGGKPLTLQL